MAEATSFTFAPLNAQDGNSDALAFAWRFGDGASASGASVTHVYRTAGSFTVDLSVSDGQATVAAPSTKIEVGANLTAGWRHVSLIDRQCSDVPNLAPGQPQPNCVPYTMLALNLAQSGSEIAGSITPNVDFFPIGVVAFPLTGTVAPVAHPGLVRFSTPDQPISAINNDTYSFVFDGRTDASGGMLIGTLTQTRKYRPQSNPFGVLICNSREPIVTCPPDVRSSTSTFTRQ
jgi:PKD repeat protein